MICVAGESWKVTGAPWVTIVSWEAEALWTVPPVSWGWTSA